VWSADLDNIQPRIGLTFSLDAKTLLHAGAGVYYAPFGVDAVNQAGFSQSTPVPASPDAGLTFPATLADPFPFGVADPPGSSRGLLTNVGRTEDVVPLDRRNARSIRFLAGFQRELPGGMRLEANYVGNRSSDLDVSGSIDAIPRRYLSTSDLRDDAAIELLETDRFPNPFFGDPLLGAAEPLRVAERLPRGQLLKPYPQFTDLIGHVYDGRTSYDALQVRLEKRFGGGFNFLGGYTFSRFTERASRLDPTDATYEARPHVDDARHALTASAIWKVPMARGSRGWRSALLGGWTLTGLFTAQTGRPIDLPDLYYGGDPTALAVDWGRGRYDPATGRVRSLFPIDGFYLHDAPVQYAGSDDPAKQRADPRIQRSSHLRTFPTRLDGFRTQTRPILDASVVKQVAVRGRWRAQLRIEVFNALDFVELSLPSLDPASASFGDSTGQENFPRELQIGLKLLF
jgi:hypothetical protein